MSARGVQLGSRMLPIGGKEIHLTDEVVPLEDVRLDPDNPRLRSIVRDRFNGKSPTQEQLRDIVLELPSVDLLQADIRVSGGLMEPIYVTSDGLVVEGNCRTAVCMRLRESLKTEPRWKEIRVYRFPDTVTRHQLAVFQAKHHITSGKKAWERYEKSNHIYHMHNELGMSVKEIAESLYPRMHEETIRQDLETYAQLTNYLTKGQAQPPPSKKRAPPSKKSASPRREGAAGGRDAAAKGKGGSIREWSYFHEFNKRTDLAEFRKIPANVKRFERLVRSGRLVSAMNVRNLASIIKTPGAFEALEKQGIEEALKLVARDDPTAGSPLFKVLTAAVDALRKFQKSEIAGIKQQKKQQQIIRTLHSKLCGLAEAAGIKLEDHGA